MDGKAERRWLGTSPCDNERTITLRTNALRAYEGKSSELIPPGPRSRVGTHLANSKTPRNPPSNIAIEKGFARDPGGIIQLCMGYRLGVCGLEHSTRASTTTERESISVTLADIACVVAVQQQLRYQNKFETT